MHGHNLQLLIFFVLVAAQTSSNTSKSSKGLNGEKQNKKLDINSKLLYSLSGELSKLKKLIKVQNY